MDTMDVHIKTTRDTEVDESEGKPATSTTNAVSSGGACEFFGTLPPLHLAAILGRDVGGSAHDQRVAPGLNSDDRLDSYDKLNENRHMHYSKNDVAKTTETEIDTYPLQGPITTSFDKNEVLMKWVYKAEGGRTVNVPSSTRWVTEWFLSRRLGTSSFAPSFLEQSNDLGPQGRSRITKKLRQIRELCTGEFRTCGDVIKTFICAWNRSPLHSCQSVMHVVLCSSHLDEEERKQINVQCVWLDSGMLPS